MKVSRKNAIKGWWFASSDTLPNGDGRKVVLGKHHHVKGEIEKCSRGLHSSRRAIDALQYNCGPMVYYVESWGEVDEDEDKLAASNRAYIHGINAEKILEKFGRWCALSVIDKWDAPEVVVQFLKTGKESLRDAARAAAWAAMDAMDAARAAAMAAMAAMDAMDAARAAAWAAMDAAMDAQNKKLESMLLHAMGRK